jgi:hypothetical protein
MILKGFGCVPLHREDKARHYMCGLASLAHADLSLSLMSYMLKSHSQKAAVLDSGQVRESPQSIYTALESIHCAQNHSDGFTTLLSQHTVELSKALKFGLLDSPPPALPCWSHLGLVDLPMHLNIPLGKLSCWCL